MRWRKLGLLYAPDGTSDWVASHAAVPTPLRLSDDIVRLYVAHADRQNISRQGYVDVALSDPTRPLRVAQAPLLDIGPRGSFDDNGIHACSALWHGDQLRLYYLGYQLQPEVPYTLISGLATAPHPDGPFEKAPKPILPPTPDERFFRTAPFVLHENGRWRMWYIGGDAWVQSGAKRLPLYSLRHIELEDGLTWNAASTECMTPRGPDEIGFGRPFIVRVGDTYRMWYSVRSTAGYRLGYATSPDGLVWTRRDAEVGIEPSSSGWDSEMICFAAVLRHGSRWFMYYNGNGYGRTGVGVAVSDDD